jgi:hypothetical protein
VSNNISHIYNTTVQENCTSVFGKTPGHIDSYRMKFVQDTEEEVPPLKIGSKMCVVEGECFGCRLTNRSVMIFEPGERLILPRRNPDIIPKLCLDCGGTVHCKYSWHEYR